MMDTNDNSTIKDIISITSPLIKSLVDTFITPKLVAFRDRINVTKSNTYIPSEDDFQEYYHRTFKKLVVVNTLVFRNSQRFLTDIYLPLTLNSVNKNIREKVKGFPKKISDKYGNILITDTAGMGKSTLMKFVFINTIQENLGVPLFIELRRLNRNKKLIEEIQEQLNSINKSFDSDLLLDFLAEGEFIIILDGYDEISLLDRDVVTKDIQEFIAKASNNRYFITSRPEKSLSSFGNFQEFNIEPLSKKEAFELIRKYDKQGVISSLLIKKLQEKELQNIEEFLINPLLVSLLFTAFEHKQAIPFKKYLFYRQVYDANFESHDLTKGDSFIHEKYSKLEIDDFHFVLRHLGFNCFKLQKIEFTKDEILKLISESKNFCAGLSFKESDFLQDLIKTVPLFSQDGNYYRWCHKSLQEYFAAQFIYLDSKEKQSAILLKLYEHPNIDKFHNVFDLYYDMDYKTFRNLIELHLLKEYEAYANSVYKGKFEGVDIEDITRRKELGFLVESYLFFTKSKKFDHEKIDEMLAKFIEHNELKENKFFGIAHESFRDQGFFCIHYSNSKVIFLKLLASKKNNIVKYTRFKDDDVEKLNIDIKIKDEYRLIKIDDNNSSSWNSSNNFHKTNFMIAISRFDSFTIDDNNAKMKLKEIDKEIHLEKESNFLLNIG